jgi:hypothetical protein
MKILEFLDVAEDQFAEIYDESISYFESKATSN